MGVNQQKQTMAIRPVTWLATLLVLIFSVLLLYLPYQFQTEPYELIYPYLRWLGCAAAFAGLLELASLLEPRLPAWLGGVGKLLLVGALAVLTWFAALPAGSLSQVLVYGLVGLVVLLSVAWPGAEALLFDGFYLAILLGLGGLLGARGDHLPLAALGPIPAAVSLGAIGIGLLLAVSMVRGRRWRPFVMLLVTLPLAWVGLRWWEGHNWLGAGLYTGVVVAAVVRACYDWWPWDVSLLGLRRRIVALTVTLAVLPVFVIGAVAVYMSQRLDQAELERHLKTEVLQAQRALAEGIPVQGTADDPDVSVQLVPMGDLPARWAQDDGVAFVEEIEQGRGRHLVAYLRLPDRGVAIVVTEGAVEAYARAARLGEAILVGTLLAALAAAAAGYVLARYLTRRIGAVRDVAVAIGAQHFDARVVTPAGTDDEMTDLADSINQMASALEAYSEEIQAQEEELLAQGEELQAQNEELLAQGRELREQALLQAELSSIGLLALSEMGPAAMMDAVAERLTTVLEVPFCKVLELRPDGHTLLLRAGRGWHQGLVGHLTIDAAEAHGGATLAAGGPIVVENGADDGRFADLPLLREHGVVSGVSVIIHGTAGPLGTLAVCSDQPRKFASREVLFMQGVANLLATVVQRAATERLTAVEHAVTRILAGSASLPDAVSQVLQVIGGALDWQVGALWLSAGAGEPLRCQCVWHAADTPVPGFIADATWAAGEAVWISDLTQATGNPQAAGALTVGLRCAFCFPVRDGDKVLGAMAFYCGEVRRSDPELLAVCDNIGSQVGQFVQRRLAEEDRAVLLAEAQAARNAMALARDRLAFLAESSALLTATLDYTETLQNLARLTVPTLADYCAVDLLEGDAKLRRMAVVHVDTDKERLVYELLGEDIDMAAPTGVPAVIRSGTPLLIGEVTDDLLGRHVSGGKRDALMRSIGLKSVLVVPLLARGRALGSITLAFTESDRHYGDEDLGLAMELARRAALAVDNARLYQELQAAFRLMAGQKQILEMVATGLSLNLVMTALTAFLGEFLQGRRCVIRLMDQHGQLRETPSPAQDLRGKMPAWSTPIIASDGDLLGSIDIHRGSGGQPQPVELGLVETASRLAAIAIERKRLEEGQNRKLQSLIEQMGDGVVAVDEDQQIIVVNPAAQRLLGLLDPLVARSLDEAALPPALVDALHQAVQSDHLDPVRFTFSSDSLEVDAHVSPVVTELGSHGAIAILHDVTSQVQFRQLQESFVANVSHELRGPLTSVSATLEAMTDGLIPEEARPKYLKAILAEMGRLRRLSYEVVELSRLETNTVQVQREEFALGLVFEGLEEKWTHRCATAGLRLEVEQPACRVLADYDRVEQVIANLLENAVRFTAAGGVIRLGAEVEGRQVRISVSDTGVGIPPEHLPYVWERFYKVDPARTLKANSGTGLGLAIVRQLVDLMGGTVQVISEPGRGSSFSFTLPLAAES